MAGKGFGLCLLLKLGKFSKGVLINPLLLRNRSCLYSNIKLPCDPGCATGTLCACSQPNWPGDMTVAAVVKVTGHPTTSWALPLCLSP